MHWAQKEFAVCWKSQVPSLTEAGFSPKCLDGIWYLLEYGMAPFSLTLKTIWASCVSSWKPRAREHLMLYSSGNETSSLVPTTLGFPAFAGMGVSAVPWCPLNNCFFFFIFLQWFLKRVGLHEEFALGFTAWVRGRLSCLGQGTIVTLAKPFSVSSWHLQPVALTLLILAPPKVWAPASEEEILNIFVSWHKEAFHPKGSEHH